MAKRDESFGRLDLMTLDQVQARALGDPTRHRIFRYLGDADHPVGVAELTEQIGVHHNAVRQHLAQLVAAGLVVEVTARPDGPGRPRLQYSVSAEATTRWLGVSPYERLSVFLTDMLRTGESAVEAGRRAGRTVRGEAAVDDAVTMTVASMARHGFDPEVRKGDADVIDIVLRRCPYVSAALVDPATICGIHRGFAEGFTEGSRLHVENLAPRDPETAGCVLRLRVSS